MKGTASHILLLLLILFGCAALAPALGQASSGQAATAAERDPNNWKQFSSAEGRFAILFPGMPKESAEAVETPGGPVPIHKITLRTFAEYGVIYADYPMQINDPAMANRILDNGAKGAVAEVGAQLLSMTEISLAGQPGRLLKERMRDGHIMRVKMYLVGQRLYQVAITTPVEEGASPETVRFYEATASMFLDTFTLSPAAQLVSEGEVDKALRELKEKGEMVIGPYREDDPASKSAGKGSVAQVLNGRAISLPQPTYPPIAVAAHASGTVVVEVILDLDGKVMAAQVVSGHPLLQAASLKAARLAQFSPTLLNGKPVRIIGNITYNFVARRKGL